MRWRIVDITDGAGVPLYWPLALVQVLQRLEGCGHDEVFRGVPWEALTRPLATVSTRTHDGWRGWEADVRRSQVRALGWTKARLVVQKGRVPFVRFVNLRYFYLRLVRVRVILRVIAPTVRVGCINLDRDLIP
jgi:hypothetical protein